MKLFISPYFLSALECDGAVSLIQGETCWYSLDKNWWFSGILSTRRGYSHVIVLSVCTFQLDVFVSFRSALVLWMGEERSLSNLCHWRLQRSPFLTFTCEVHVPVSVMETRSRVTAVDHQKHCLIQNALLDLHTASGDKNM